MLDFFPSRGIINVYFNFGDVMQTFLNELTFSATAERLDKKRLQKQLLEGRQILEILLVNTTAAWRNHPAVLMWKGHEYWLYLYLKQIMLDCKERGINVEKNWEVISNCKEIIPTANVLPPEWWTDEKLQHRVVTTHRARLWVKNKEFYSAYENNFDEAETLRCCSHCNYFWPTHWAKNGNKFLVTTKKRAA